MNLIVNALIISGAIIMSNIGARHIVADVENIKLFSHPNMRYVYIFSMAYIGTRDVSVSAFMALLYGIIRNFHPAPPAAQARNPIDQPVQSH